ncbi:MAG: type II toxin-antitoxin system VapC family toxin [Nonomuraea sp.]|nr:type II toxin-antitoxin system VapC family toxin [Nonomuraea sp.]
MIERRTSGVIDTRVFIDLSEISPDALPTFPELTTITLAELQQGVAMAKDPATRALRAERLGLDLMIAAVASGRGLPLYTRNTDVFVGLESLVTIVPV